MTTERINILFVFEGQPGQKYHMQVPKDTLCTSKLLSRLVEHEDLKQRTLRCLKVRLNGPSHVFEPLRRYLEQAEYVVPGDPCHTMDLLAAASHLDMPALCSLLYRDLVTGICPADVTDITSSEREQLRRLTLDF